MIQLFDIILPSHTLYLNIFELLVEYKKINEENRFDFYYFKKRKRRFTLPLPVPSYTGDEEYNNSQMFLHY